MELTQTILTPLKMKNSINKMYSQLNDKLNHWYFFVSYNQFEVIHNVKFGDCDLEETRKEWHNFTIEQKLEKYNLIVEMFDLELV